MDMSFFKKRLLVSMVIVSFIIVFGIYVYSEYSKEPIRQEYAETQQYINQNKTGSQKILTEIMDEARTCYEKEHACIQAKGKDCAAIRRCRADITQKIYSNLNGTENLERFPSTYFIRVSENNIEKLFLNGEFKITEITAEEKYIADVLHGNEQGTTLHGLRVNEIYSNMKYLNDLPSEAEIIVPVQSKGEVMGAYVRLYGD